MDRVVDKMLKETPPETEEERQNCETMRETIKGMFLTQRRSKTEAAFITENIDRYEELFEICMNGDDAQFKRVSRNCRKHRMSIFCRKRGKTDEQGHFDGSSHERPECQIFTEE